MSYTARMRGKQPSSLDYEAYVDELAVSSFRRAIAERRFTAARASNERLLGSSQRMWRWVGHRNLAALELARGFPERALTTLANGERLFPGVRRLVEPFRMLAVAVLLETTALQRAAAIARPDSYEHALALARLGRRAEAQRVARRLGESSPLAAHVRWELNPDGAEGLRRIAETLVVDPAGARATVSVRFQLARALEDEGSLTDALAIYTEILSTPEALLDDTLPYVRSCYRSGVVSARVGEEHGARETFALFLEFWNDGEMDRDAVLDARQRVNA